MGDKKHEFQLQKFIKIKNEFGSEDIHYSMLCEDIPDEYKTIALKQLNETEENKAKGVLKLKEFMKKENLSCPDDYHLLMVLRNCKYNIKRSETKLKKFLKTRQAVIERLVEIDPIQITLILDDLCIGALPYRDKYGRIILFSRPDAQFDLYDASEVELVLMAFLLFLMTFPLTSIVGLSYIGECKSSSMYVFYSIFKVFKSLILHVFDYPLRYARVDFTNENFLCRWFYNVVRTLLPGKLTKRVIFHGEGYTSLQKFFHPDILPEEFDGNLGPLNDKIYRNKFISFVEKLKSERTHL